jgi:hypothetical protein
VSSRHRPPTSAPLSTRIAVGFGLLLVVGGFALAGWERLTEDDSTEVSAPTGPPTHEYLPNVETVVAYAGAIVAVVIAGGYVLVRARRRRSGL